MAERRIFELRTYRAHPGKLDALVKHFRDDDLDLFERHHMDMVAFWVAKDAEGQPTDSFVYLLAFESQDAAKAAWKAFLADPDFTERNRASQSDGPLVAGAESVFLEPTDYSPLV
ncbi:MAG TPA: NIPSNAP family protein [Acidimicrobiales bacterium]|jgi:hypothetical protein